MGKRSNKTPNQSTADLAVLVGSLLRIKRKARKWSISDVAALSGLAEFTTADVESGRSMPSPIHLTAYAKALGTTGVEILKAAWEAQEAAERLGLNVQPSKGA